MPNQILLTGAGFSRNWGGWLANEAFEYLLGSTFVDDALRQMLWHSKEKKAGFEDTLSTLQAAYLSRKDYQIEKKLRALTEAVKAMFAEMGEGYEYSSFEFVGSTGDSTVRSFLSRFDAIYTLNQDTLLEQHYIGGAISSPGKACPGISPKNAELQIGARTYPVYGPTQHKFELGEYQPYIKLHGSFNWMQDEQNLLILGGGKAASIAQFPLLTWYYDLFRSTLRQPETRLMVIGYSFNDQHINQAILDAAEASNLRVFIIDPAGVDVLDKRPAEALVRERPYELLDKLSPRIIGASRRGFREIFGGDRVEHAKVMRFFKQV